MSALFNLGKNIGEEGRRVSAHFYVEHIIIPIIDKLAKDENVNTEQEIKNLIQRRERLTVYADNPEFRKRLIAIVNYPGVHFILTRFRSQLNTPVPDIIASVPWWMDRIKETKPSLYNAIDGEPDGRLWLGETLVDILILFREFVK